jgi:hypothetical protein
MAFRKAGTEQVGFQEAERRKRQHINPGQKRNLRVDPPVAHGLAEKRHRRAGDDWRARDERPKTHADHRQKLRFAGGDFQS